MSYQIQRLKDTTGIPYIDIIKEIIVTHAFDNETEINLLERILEEHFEEEKSLETCQKNVGMKPKVDMTQDELVDMKRKLDELKSDMSKNVKEDFKRNVKELCGIDVLHDTVSMHLPKPTEEKMDTVLHRESGRLLAYLTKRKELMKILRAEVKSMREIEERKFRMNSQRARKRRQLIQNMEVMIKSLSDVTSGIGQIEKALKSLNQSSKVAYAKMVSRNFQKIKSKLLRIVKKSIKLENDMREFLKEGRRGMKNTPDYIDEECEICIPKEKSWDDRWVELQKCDDRLRTKDARILHSRMVRSGAMRGLVDQMKSFLSCEISDPEVALPTFFCSMTDPKRAKNLNNLISQNNFLKEFKHNLLQKCMDEKIPTATKKDCMVCGVTLKSCTF